MKILDCSLRDGSYTNDSKWPEPIFKQIVESLQPHVDIIEIGYRRPGKTGFEYCDDYYIDKVLGQKYDNLAIMIDYKDYVEKDLWMDHFKPVGYSPITYIRIACCIDDIEEALFLAVLLHSIGYKTTINIMKTSMLNYSGLKKLEELTYQGMFKHLACLYFADSFGNMFDTKMLDSLSFLMLSKNVPIGYHPHNNLGTAFTHWKDENFDIIDSSIGGLGRGAGNLDTIQVLLDRDKKLDYKLYKCLKYIEKIKKKAQCGYSYEYHYCAINNIHPNYAVYLKGLHKYGRYDIINMLMNIDKDKRNSFDKEYVEGLVNIESWWK